MSFKKYLMCLYLLLSLHTSHSFPVEDSPKNSSSKGYEPVSLALAKRKVDTATSQQQTHLLDNEFKQKYLSWKQQKLKQRERVLLNSDECHFNFNLSDTQSAERYVATELLKPDDVFAFYIYLNAKNSNKRSKEYFDDINKLNSLQEWIWLESSMTFNVLKSPIDIGAITFTISKYGTRNVWLEWTLPDTCGPNNPIGYYNESHRLILYILENLIENNTLKDSYLCHRNFDCDTSFIEWCWWITTVWIGYDYNCYPINTLHTGNFGSILISKTDLSKLLTFVVGLIGYMHPFLWHILESVQLPWLPKTKKRRELRKYYKDTYKIEKPYGYVRVLQKIFFRYNKELCPIISFFAFSTVVLFVFNLYKLLNIRNEMFKEDGYDNFPNVYRFGVPEYTSMNRSYTFPISIVAYFVCNIWIYVRYNENNMNKEFIICIPNTILGRSWRVVPGFPESTKTLIASEKLVYRFKFLFSKKFWLLIWCRSFETPMCMKNSLKLSNLKILYVFVFFPMIILIFIINIILNIVLCTLPALWFVFLMPYILYDKYISRTDSHDDKQPAIEQSRSDSRSSPNSNTHTNENTTVSSNSQSIQSNSINSTQNEETPLPQISAKILLTSIGELFLFLLYLLTLREQIGLCIFILRSLCYTIIFGFIAPGFVMRCFILVIASLGYFLSYFLSYIDLYSTLLKLVFTVQEETKKKKNEGNQKVESGTNAIKHICAANRKAESGRNKNEQNVDEITEDLFNYVVDNCSTVKRSSFLLIVKTFMTIIFLTVTLMILRDTGKLQDLNLNEIVPFLLVLISPKVVSIFTAYKTEDEIKRHKGDIEKLIKDFNTNGKTNKVHDIHVLNAYVFCI